MVIRPPSNKAQAWRFFDRIVMLAAPGGHHTSPWSTNSLGELEYHPDFATLERLLAVPLHLNASTTTGVPALALDVWLSYELRRSGFDSDATWPRAEAPRVLPGPVASLLHSLPHPERKALLQRMLITTPSGVAPSQALILGKNYRKQVDVVMSNWSTGPEVLISTKRMDSSFGKNAQNRIEEAYGDAKNLRLRHPMAALGFFFGIRSTAFTQESRTAEFIADLLLKLGQEDDAYHATCLLPIEYGSSLAASSKAHASSPETGDHGSRPREEADGSGGGLSRQDTGAATNTFSTESAEPEQDAVPQPFAMFDAPPANSLDEPDVEWQDALNFDQGVDVDAALAEFPAVSIKEEFVPEALRAGTFLARIVTRVLAATPTTLHESARDRIKEASRG